MMHLKVFSPTEVVLDTPVRRVTAEAIDGFYTLLPKHIDFVTALKPGILTYLGENGEKAYVACNQGVLVKKGAAVSVSARWALAGTDITQLRKIIGTTFKETEQERKEVNLIMAQLEIDLTKGLISLKENTGKTHVGL